MSQRLIASLFIVLCAGCVARDDGAMHAPDFSEPPLTLAVAERDGELVVTLATRADLGGFVTFVVDDEAGRRLALAPGKTGVTRLPRGGARGPWQLTARWVDPAGRAGATAVMSSTPAREWEPKFLATEFAHVGALPVSSAIPIETRRP